MPITAEMRWRLLLAISRDTALEPLDVRVAVELIDKLAAATRTRLDFDTLTTNVSAAASGLRNALERLIASGYIAVTGSRRGYAGHNFTLVLGATAIVRGMEGG